MNTSLQTPSLISSFADLEGVFLSYFSVSVAISFCKHCPICIIASADVCFTISEVTKLDIKWDEYFVACGKSEKMEEILKHICGILAHRGKGRGDRTCENT